MTLRADIPRGLVLRRMFQYLFFIGTGLLFSSFALSADRAETNIVTLTSVQDVRQYSPGRNPLPSPIHLVGTITFHDPKRRLTFLQDATGGIALEGLAEDPRLRSGLRVELEGSLAGWGDSKSVAPRFLKILGAESFPRPVPVSNARKAVSTAEHQWVSVTGIIHDVDSAEHPTTLRLALQGGHIQVMLPSGATWSQENLVDSKVTVQGVWVRETDKTSGLEWTKVLVPSPSLMTVETLPADEPFRLPVRSITNLLQVIDPGAGPFPRTRLEGTVTAAFPDDKLFIHDQTGNMCVRYLSHRKPQVGELISVAGFPEFGADSLEVVDALIQFEGWGDVPERNDLELSQPLSREREGELIRVTGRVISHVDQTNQVLLWLGSQNVLFGAVIPMPAKKDSLSRAIKRESLLELSGICSSVRPEPGQGQSFRVLLRSENDLRVLERPYWWTWRHTSFVLGFMGLVTSFTTLRVIALRRELKRQTEVIRRSEEHLRLAVHAAKVGTWEFHPQSGELIWNDFDFGGAGRSDTRIVEVKEQLLEHIHPVDRDLVRKTVKAAALTGEPFQLEYRIRNSRGEDRWRFMQGHGLKNDQGRVIRVIGATQDVTPRKHAEQALREREEIYRAMFEKNRAVKMLVDPETGKIVDANPAAAQFYGYYLSELRAKTLQELTPLPEKRTLEALRRAMSGDTNLFHLKQSLSNGSLRDVEICTGSLCVGGRALLFCIVLDVSEQVRATEAMRRLNEVLEGRVQERTEELQRRVAEVEELNRHMVSLLEDLKAAHLEAAEAARNAEKANLQLQTINQELEAFSYSVSHDLRAPLRHIAGYVSILQESHASKLDAEGSRHLETISNAAKRMGQLIDDLLAFSRIGRTQLTLHPIQLNSLVKDVIRELSPEVQSRSIDWILHPLPSTRADPSLLRQVWFNLIENALKYTRPRAAATIEIGVLEDSENKNEDIFYVRDNGVGFDMRYTDKLFGVFQRLHSASQFEGTGIGLANVRRIILRHGGRTWANAEPDRGATFFFTLPRHDSSPGKPTPWDSLADARNTSPFSRLTPMEKPS